MQVWVAWEAACATAENLGRLKLLQSISRDLPADCGAVNIEALTAWHGALARCSHGIQSYLVSIAARVSAVPEVTCPVYFSDTKFP